MIDRGHQPVVYGDGEPGRIAVPMANVIEREPDAMFRDPSVQDVGHHPAGLIQRRVAGPCHMERPDEGEVS